MDLTVLNLFKDNKMNCLSVLAETNISSYLSYVEDIFSNQGGIDGQRAPLKSKTAIQIRNRMVDDISKGAVLPPLVIGLLVDTTVFDSIESDKESLKQIITTIDKENVSIIDGMQRTTSIKSALEINGELETPLRVDFWIAKDINNLIYRMLILNTAQIPWSTKRQLEVVFNPLKRKVEENIPGITLYTEDERSRRSHPGEYQASNIIELFLNFSVKKIQIDLKESLAEEFARLDIIESTSHNNFLDDFISSFKYLYELDSAYSSAGETQSDLELNKFKRGIDLFSSHPARIGFITSISHFIYGKPGFNHSDELISEKRNQFKSIMDDELRKITSLSPEDLYEYLDFSTLDERISRKSGKVGEFERDFFLKAFSEYFTILNSGTDIPSLQPIWLAYS